MHSCHTDHTINFTSVAGQLSPFDHYLSVCHRERSVHLHHMHRSGVYLHQNLCHILALARTHRKRQKNHPYYITLLLHYCIAALLHCCIAALLHYITTLLHYCITTLLHYYITTLLHYYITTLLHYYITTLLHYYITTLLHYYITTLLHYYSAVLIHYYHYFISFTIIFCIVNI